VTIALVAAQAENQVIGQGLEIPWRVKGEQALFKQITMGGTLIMGRKTYDSIGRPLPGRTTIVVTRNKLLQIDGVIVTHSLEAALEQAQAIDAPVFVVGGGDLYRQAMPVADELHLTTIHTEVDGDVYFPPVPDSFEVVTEERFSSNIDYTYRHLKRTGGPVHAV
jgi:dihydrofolate reductase (trimethoprim resistance protein)